MINILIHVADRLPAGLVEHVVQRVLQYERVSSEAEISVVITGDAEIRALNARFRGIDATTDVLSFVEEDTALPFVLPPDALPYLGDVIVSLPRAQSQAQEHGHSVETELQLLLVHGVLHLLGYDHDTPASKAQMWARQDAILNLLKA